MSNKYLMIFAIFTVVIFNLVIAITCIRYDNYVKELKEKANKYDLMTNSVEVEDEHNRNYK